MPTAAQPKCRLVRNRDGWTPGTGRFQRQMSTCPQSGGFCFADDFAKPPVDRLRSSLSDGSEPPILRTSRHLPSEVPYFWAVSPLLADKSTFGSPHARQTCIQEALCAGEPEYRSPATRMRSAGEHRDGDTGDSSVFLLLLTREAQGTAPPVLVTISRLARRAWPIPSRLAVLARYAEPHSFERCFACS